MRNARPASAACKDVSAGNLNPAQAGVSSLLDDDEKLKKPVAKSTDEEDVTKAGERYANDPIYSGAPGSEETEDTRERFAPEDFSSYIPLIKSNDEEQTVTGVVLVPEEVDAQGDIYDKQVIRNCAFDFLSHYNEESNLGLMHKDMDPPFALCESYVAPCEMMIGLKTVKEGTWIMTVKINDKKIWAKVKSGKITGFSVGGIAKIKKIPSASAGV